jgi:hypothetical protein
MNYNRYNFVRTPAYVYQPGDALSGVEELCLQLPSRFGNYCRMRVDVHVNSSRTDMEEDGKVFINSNKSQIQK